MTFFKKFSSANLYYSHYLPLNLSLKIKILGTTYSHSSPHEPLTALHTAQKPAKNSQKTAPSPTKFPTITTTRKITQKKQRQKITEIFP
jgi:hypothetical protein